jgi:hypothetical protein
MVHKARQELLGCLSRLAQGETARKAQEAHARFHIHEPTIEEIARYAKCSSVESAVTERCVESILAFRTSPLGMGPQRQEVAEFQKAILGLLETGPQEGRVACEYGKLAISISRLIARSYADGCGKRSLKVDGRLEAALPHLAAHLLAETGLYLEAKFARPHINLSKVSVFDIQEKLEMLRSHKDAVVRDHARSIIFGVLKRGDLALADGLAAGAQAKLKMLRNHNARVVRYNALNIMCTALHQADLALAERLAAGAQAKLEMLRNPKMPKVVRDHARSIVCGILNKGNPALADKLAAGAQAKLEMLRSHKDESVRANAMTILQTSFLHASLAMADRLAEGAQKKLEELKSHDSPRIRAVAPMVLSALLTRDNLGARKVTIHGEVFVLKKAA